MLNYTLLTIIPSKDLQTKSLYTRSRAPNRVSGNDLCVNNVILNISFLTILIARTLCLFIIFPLIKVYSLHYCQFKQQPKQQTIPLPWVFICKHL